MTPAEFSVIFVFGLISSLHCVQMCGPLVVSYSIPLGGQSAGRQWLAHLAYHFGRIMTYSLLGGVAGLTGQTLRVIGDLAGIENVVAVVAGALMIVAGLLMLDLIPHRFLQRFDLFHLSSRFLQPLGRRIASPNASSKFTLGLILGLMPCGLVYAALLKALSTGGVLGGALTMTAFGLGTAGALLAIGVFSSAFSRKLAKLQLGIWGSRITAISVTVLGAFLLWRGIVPMISPHAPGDPACHTE